MDLLDRVTDKIKELKDDGIAIAEITCASGDERVKVVVGSLETRDIFEPGRDTNPAKSEEEDLDLYHVR